jgi:hypothetical protein
VEEEAHGRLRHAQHLRGGVPLHAGGRHGGAAGRVLAEVTIDEPHPRTDAFRVTQKFAAYAKQLSEHLAEASSLGGEQL